MYPEYVPHHDGASKSDAPSVFESGVSTLTGSVERVVYFNEETGQCVLDIKTPDSRNHTLVSGLTAFVHPGSTIEAQVLPTSDADESFDGQRQALHIEVKAPNSDRTLKKFLKSGALSDMTPHLATLLSKAFPQNLFQVLDESPDRLIEVPGIGKKRLTQILESWSEYKTFSDLRRFLFSRNLPLSWGKTLWKTHETNSLDFLKTHPYSTVFKYLFPFDLIDSFALREGFGRESSERIRCALFDLLQNHYKQGHCAYSEEKLLREATEKLAVSPQMIEEALELEILEERLIADTIGEPSCLYLKEIWDQERNVAEKLLSFEHRTPPWGWFNMPKALTWAQSLLNIQLAPLQKEAIEKALNSSLSIITGGPGTGKTTLIRSLVTILKTQSSSFALCTPTGRAAQRLEEATGAQATTIHRLLKYDSMTGKFVYNKDRRLSVDLVLIDEVSMVDLSLMSHLLDALPENCSLILVGDVDQIPSVGAGNVLQSLIDCERFTTVRLTAVYRHRDNSLIKTNAHRINSGEMPLIDSSDNSDFHYIPVHGIEETKRVVTNLLTRIIPERYGIKDPRHLQILVPLNKGPLGTQQLNEDFKEHFSHSDSRSAKSIAGFGQNYRVGDKVMVVRNDYKKNVFNGDIGFIQDIDHSGQFVDILFDERSVRFLFEELDRIALAYAISIHKSQGSEYRAVIVVISKEHLPLAQRHLIYTAVTRGKEHVFLVADPGTLQTAVLSDENNHRFQKLTELLKPAPSRLRSVGNW